MRKNRTARLLGIAAASGLILSIAACSSESGDNATTSADTAPDSITVWTWTVAPGEDSMNAMAKAYEAETGIRVESKIISRDDYKAQVQLALNANEKIDVLGVQPSQFALDIEQQLTPVSSWVGHIDGGLDAYNPTTIEQSKRLYGGDEIYSVPFGSTGSAVCFYNADILNEVGVDPPATWDDMAALTAALKIKMPDVLPLVMPAGGIDGWFVDEFVLTMVGQKDPSFFDTVRYDGGQWTTDSYTAAVQKFGDLFESGVLDSAALDLGYGDAMNVFNTGKAAIACNGTWEAGMLLPSFREANGLAMSGIGVMPVPTDGTGTASARAFLDITWGIPTTSDSPDAAADFIAWSTTGAGVDIWAPSLGFLPAAAGWSIDSSVFNGDTLAAEGYQTIQELIGSPSSDRNNLSSLSAQIGTHLLEVANGRLSASAAVTSIQSDADSGKFN